MFVRGFLGLIALSVFWGGMAYLLGYFGLHVSPLITAVLGGMITSAISPRLGEALQASGALKFGTKEVLRLGIVFYGLHISLNQIFDVGLIGLGFGFCVVVGTLVLGTFLGQKMGLDKHSALLVSAGSAICGAAAVLAVQSVTKSQSEKVVTAVATVVFFGTIGMIFYPWLLNGVESHFVQGVVAGGTLHEVAHVVGAGAGLSKEAAEVAIIVKMIRVMLLVPVLFVLLFFFESDKKGVIKGSFPWFALFFLVMVGLNSWFEIPFKQELISFDLMLLCIAMCALGLNTHVKTLKKVGLKPFALAGVLMLWLIGFGGVFIQAYM